MAKDEIRKIIHVDMDAFYASIEVHENPSLRGKPVIVGGNPHSRGVVATCSYEARAFGIHSAMPSRKALQLCPHAVFIKPNHDLYKKVSMKIQTIFKDYTDQVEPLALDEAFLDVTENKKASSAIYIAQAIQKDIYKQTGLTASAGVSYNKFLAKMASDIRKPNGLYVILPHEAEDFLEALPIEKFFGVGKATALELRKIGIYKGEDLKRLSQEFLMNQFGKKGKLLYDFARGIDERPVNAERKRKSIGAEYTFEID